MQAGTQSTRERVDAGALAAERTMGRKCPGWRFGVSMALGENVFFLAMNSILPCVSGSVMFLSLFDFFLDYSPFKNVSPGFQN